MKTTGMAFLAGMIFAVGLVISEMTKPDKVIGFLDLAGSWDPSLAFVMVGAIGVHAVTYRVITQRNTSWCGAQTCSLCDAVARWRGA